MGTWKRYLLIKIFFSYISWIFYPQFRWNSIIFSVAADSGFERMVVKWLPDDKQLMGVLVLLSLYSLFHFPGDNNGWPHLFDKYFGMPSYNTVVKSNMCRKYWSAEFQCQGPFIDLIFQPNVSKFNAGQRLLSPSQHICLYQLCGCVLYIMWKRGNQSVMFIPL